MQEDERCSLVSIPGDAYDCEYVAYCEYAVLIIQNNIQECYFFKICHHICHSSQHNLNKTNVHSIKEA